MPKYTFLTYLCMYTHIKLKHRQDQYTVIDQSDLIYATEEKQCQDFYKQKVMNSFGFSVPLNT